MAKKQITINDLAHSVKNLSDAVADLAKDMKTGFRMIRSDMAGLATKEDLKDVKGTVDSIYKMLDSETHFIKKMESEYPIFIKRFERLEDKLGLPHSLSET